MIFDMAEAEGIKMNVLDIGGGFPGADNQFFEQIATVINQQIEKHFPENVEIIAEPGRFLVASCQTIVTRVISARKEPDYMNYYTNEGVYGALNYIHFDTRSCRPEVLIQFEPNDKIVSTDQGSAGRDGARPRRSRSFRYVRGRRGRRRPAQASYRLENNLKFS